MWKNKMIEQGFNHTHSTFQETTGFFETREDNLESKEDKKVFLQQSRILRTRNSPRNEKEMTLTQVL